MCLEKKFSSNPRINSMQKLHFALRCVAPSQAEQISIHIAAILKHWLSSLDLLRAALRGMFGIEGEKRNGKEDD